MEIKLAQIRKERGLTLQKLSDATGIDKSLINRWERGLVDPGVKRWAVVAKALGVTLDDLIEIQEGG